MKTINIFVNSFPKTSETFIYNKVKGLLENGFKVNVIASQIENDSKGFYQSLNEFSNFNLVSAYLNRATKINTIIQSFFSFKFWKIIFHNNFNIKKSYKKHLVLKTLNFDKPDIIHFEFSGIGFQYLSYLKELKNIKIGSSFRGAAEKIKPLIDENRKQKFPEFLSQLDYYHCVSDNMAKEILKYNAEKEKIFINYPSIDVNLFSYLQEYIFNTKNKIKLISIGRLHWKKGIDIALLALQKLKKYNYNFTYTIVGDGHEYEKLKFMIHNLGLNENIVFLGFQPKDKISELLKESHIFLLPSYSEGLSNAALEAMCTGIPIVSAKAGGMEEAITHKKNGFLFEIGDVNDLYSNLKAIFENQYDLGQIRKSANYTVIEKFNLKHQKEKFNFFFNHFYNEKH